jgi:hypothetical protein
MIKTGVKNKRAVSAIVATVFLIMISITAVAVVYWTIIPFIKGNLDLDQRKVDLRIVTENGYTVYDKEKEIAFVQVERGVDNVTLHGMELMIDFEGTTYRATLRPPASGQSKSYFFNMQDMDSSPTTVSVAPVFVLDAREVLGEITSRVIMPTLNIVKSYEEIIIELEEENLPAINITEENQTVSNLCDTFIGQDPWGGCPIAMGDIEKVTQVRAGSPFFIYSKQQAVESTWANKWLKVKGGNCVNSSYSGDCVGGTSGISVSAPIYLTITTPGVVNVATCTGNNWYYIYENDKCE